MTQYDFGTIDPATTSGTDLATLIGSVRDAVNSAHQGASRPSYAVTGTIWIDNSAGAGNEVVKFYDGTVDVLLTTISGLGFASQAEAEAGVESTKVMTALRTLQSIQENAIEPTGAQIYAADSVGADAYAITLDPVPTSYATGMVINFKAGTANTGACTIDVNSLGVKSIKKLSSVDPEDDDIAIGQIVTLVYDGTNFQMQSQVANAPTPASATTTVEGIVKLDTNMRVQNQQTSGTAGGTFTSGAERTRVLNTVVSNDIVGASLGSNRITLGVIAETHTYKIEADASSAFVNGHRIKLRNTTDSTDDIVGTNTSSSSASGSPQATGTNATLSGEITITGVKVFEIQHRCETTRGSDGLGNATSFGTEIYTTVDITKKG